MVKKCKLCLLSCLLAAILGGCGDSAAIAIIDGEELASVETQQASPVDVFPEEIPAKTEIPAGLVSTTEEACETDEGLACPLVKPVEAMTLTYERTEEQQKRMEAFDALTLEEKFAALQSGEIVCTDFVHEYAWEHDIDEKLIVVVGTEKYEQWREMDMTCQSIYSFAAAFAWSYEKLEEVILENDLQEKYNLEVIKSVFKE